MGIFDSIKSVTEPLGEAFAPVSDFIGMGASAYGAYQQTQASQDMAEDQMDFQSDQARIARRYQRRMSNTAVRRNVRDMKKAGLNPILAAGGGASTPSSPSPSGAMGKAENIAGAGVATALQMKKMDADIDLIHAQTDKVTSETNPIEYWKKIADSLGIDIHKLGKLIGIDLSKLPENAATSAKDASAKSKPGTGKQTIRYIPGQRSINYTRRKRLGGQSSHHLSPNIEK